MSRIGLGSPWPGFFLVIASTTLLYSFTIAPTHVSFGDSDELTTLGYLGGVGHPRGFSLLIWLTFLFTHLPLPFSIALKANLLALGIQVLNVGLNYLIIYCVLKSLALNKKTCMIAAWVGSSSLSISSLFWFQANVLEKSSLAILLTQLTILGLITLDKVKKASLGIFGLGFLVGIGLMYHEFYWLCLPLVGWIGYATLRHKTINPKNSLLSGLGFVAGICLSLGLLWLSSQRIVSFSYPIEWSRQALTAFFTKTDYSDGRGSFYWRSSHFQNAHLALGHYFTQLNSSFPIGFLGLGVLGWTWFLGSRSRWRKPLFGLWLISGPLLVSYLGITILDPNRTYLWWEEQTLQMRMEVLSYPYLALGIGLGCAVLLTRWKQQTRLLLGESICLLVWHGYQTFFQVDLSHFQVTQQLTRWHLDHLPPQSLLLCHSDYACFSLLYQHLVEGERPDLEILPVYFKLRAHYLTTKAFTTYAFEQNPLWLLDTITTNLGKRPVFMVDLGNPYTSLLGLDQGILFPAPLGQFLHLNATPIPQTQPHTPLAYSASEGRRLPFFSYIDALQRHRLATSGYLLSIQGQPALAKAYLDEALTIQPQIPFPLVSSLQAQLLNEPAKTPPAVQNSNTLLLLSTQAYGKQQVDEALWFAYQAFLRGSDQLETLAMIAKYYQESGRIQEAAAMDKHLN